MTNTVAWSAKDAKVVFTQSTEKRYFPHKITYQYARSRIIPNPDTGKNTGRYIGFTDQRKHVMLLSSNLLAA
jgi:hypothetical protein